MTFANFLKELRAAEPELDLTPLETVLHDIECEDDVMSLALYDATRWAAAQTQYPVRVRLAFIDRLFDRAIAPDPQLQ